MQSSDLRDKLGFYRRADSGDVYGNSQGEFGASAELTAFAHVKPRLGGEAVLAGRLDGRNLVNITVRQSSDTSRVTTGWRAKNERTGEIFNVRSIIDPHADNSQRGRFWEMLCEKGVAT